MITNLIIREFIKGPKALKTMWKLDRNLTVVTLLETSVLTGVFGVLIAILYKAM